MTVEKEKYAGIGSKKSKSAALKSEKPLVWQRFLKSPIRTLAPNVPQILLWHVWSFMYGILLIAHDVEAAAQAKEAYRLQNGTLPCETLSRE